jgi:Ni,Fe-hydrogenase III large subunit
MRVPTNASANATLSGARRARDSWLGRLVARAAARDLRAFVVPGPEVARASVLDLRSAGLGFSSTPRHADVLVVVGRVPEGLREAAAVAYAQMPRPRAVLAVGVEDVSPLPGPDVSVGLDQGELSSGVAGLRRLFTRGAFDPETESFEAAALRSRTQYTCPMHPEVVQNEPGTCPKCGMDLIPLETAESDEGNAHHGHGGHDPGEHAHHEGMGHDKRTSDDEGQEHGGHSHHGDAGDEHHEAGHTEGSGEEHSHEGHGQAHGDGGSETREHGGHGRMNHGEHEGHVGHERMNHGGMGHGSMDHGDMGFMSMVEMTQGTPRSSDGLQMEWVEAPFGPLFPGLPGGLTLTFTLDGDTVAEAETGSVSQVLTQEDLNGPVGAFVERLAGLDPLSPVSYRLLALRAVESAAGAGVNDDIALARVGALERERAASHLNWLAGFGHLIGYPWLANRAEDLHLGLLRADKEGDSGIREEVRRLARRVERTPLLRRKLAGIGMVPDLAGAAGPLSRAGGKRADARTEEEPYRSLGFEPVVMEENDALARLRVRLAETEQSLGLAEKAGRASITDTTPEVGASGKGAAVVETPRGAATLTVTLENGEVTAAELETPSARHIGLVEPVTEQRELADALVGVASLDLSPWEMVR